MDNTNTSNIKLDAIYNKSHKILSLKPISTKNKDGLIYLNFKPSSENSFTCWDVPSDCCPVTNPIDIDNATIATKNNNILKPLIISLTFLFLIKVLINAVTNNAISIEYAGETNANTMTNKNLKSKVITDASIPFGTNSNNE